MKNKIIVGAIRWDAWVGNLNKVGLEVEKSLSNSKYHNRLPFYSNVLDDKVEIRCTNEDIIKEEIDFASASGLDYFAFCWYPFNSGLDTARNLFLNIKQNKLKWCIILGTNPFSKNDALWLINQFNNSNYQKIENRPIVYLFNINDELKEIVDFIKTNSSKYKPYFIGLVWNEKQALEMTNKFSLDALSQYCTPGKNNMNYELLSKKEKDKWNSYSKINNVVPWVTTGWDKRPRFENPVSWEKCDNFDIEYVQNPTIKQLEEQLNYAIEYQIENKGNLIIVYAWNEFDEGGFIEPVMSKNKTIDKTKLDAIKRILDRYKNR